MKIIRPCLSQGTVDIIQIMVTDIPMPYNNYKMLIPFQSVLYVACTIFFACLYNHIIVLQPVKLINGNNIKSLKILTKK